MTGRRWMWIVWPAFLMAGVLEMFVFAMVDPSDLHWRGESLEVSRQAVYTAAFFVFWAFTTASSALTALLALPPREVNRCPLQEGALSPARPGSCEDA